MRNTSHTHMCTRCKHTYLTRPAMSTTSRNAGTSFLGLYRSHSQVKRSSGTLTRACGWWCSGWCRHLQLFSFSVRIVLTSDSVTDATTTATTMDLVGIDGAEWKVFCRYAALGQQVEEGALAHIGQTDNANLWLVDHEHHPISHMYVSHC